VIESFLSDRHDLSLATRTNYRFALNAFKTWCQNEAKRPAKVADVEPGTVNAYITYQMDRGSPSTADAAWKALRSFAKFLANREIHDRQGQSVLLVVARPDVRDEERRALTDHEVQSLFEASERGEMGARDRALVWTLLGTGLRASELCGLTLDDVDLEERVLHVRAMTSKSARPRDVTLAAEVVKELDLYINDCRKGPETFDAPLFTNRRGEPLNRDSLRKVMDRLKSRSGIQGVCAHVLRHTWATNFHRSGSGTRNDLMEEGGWTTARMVDRYVKRRPLEERRRAPSVFAAYRKAIASPRPRSIEGRRTSQRESGPRRRQIA
jgi:integrase/recombinase XerD